MEDVRRIVVVVEEEEAARTALQWALHNLLRLGDVIVLLHVFPPPPHKKKKTKRLLRLHGYHLALSFRDICNAFFNTNTEIIVREGDEDGSTIAAVVREIGASTLLVGLHDNSFLYRWAMEEKDIGSSFKCKVLAIKQQGRAKGGGHRTPPPTLPHRSTSFDFSQIDLSQLQVPEVAPPKVPYRICPSPHAIIWKTRPRRSK